MRLLRPTCGADRKMYSAARCCNSWSSAVACELRMSVTCGAISVYVCASCNVATAAVTAGAAEDAARGGAYQPVYSRLTLTYVLSKRARVSGSAILNCVCNACKTTTTNPPLIGPPCDWQAGWRLQLLLGTAARCVGDHVTKLAEHVPRNLA